MLATKRVMLITSRIQTNDTALSRLVSIAFGYNRRCPDPPGNLRHLLSIQISMIEPVLLTDFLPGVRHSVKFPSNNMSEGTLAFVRLM